MASKYWQEIKKLNILGKLRNTITLPAFAVRCGEDNGSLLLNSRQSGQAAVSSVTGVELSSVFTFEIWYKTYSSFPTKGVIFCNKRAIGSDANIEISFLDSHVLVRLLKTGSYVELTSAGMYSQGDWGHLAVTYDGTTCKIFFNGKQDANTSSAAAPLDVSANTFYQKIFGSSDAFDSFYVGNIAECRIWNIALSEAVIYQNMDRRRGDNTGLQWYFRFNKINNTTLNRFNDYLTPSMYVSATFVTDIEFDSENYPPLLTGASTLAGIFDVVLAQNISLKYPVKKVSEDFTLCVSYVDDDLEERIRYKLWDIGGLDIYPQPDRYRGQVLPPSFRFEIWGIDGQESCTLEDNLLINFSKCTLPTSSRDTTQVALVDSPTLDNSISVEWGTAYPLLFTAGQFGTVASPLNQDISLFSANIPNYGGIQ